MYKLYAFWSAPRNEDVEAFEQHYAEVHLPAALAVPHLVGLTETLTSDGFEGATPATYRVAEMIFDSKEALQQSAQSQQWAAMRADSGVMIEKFGVTLQVSMGQAEEAKR
ncbi:MAG: EthD family reductase [Cumulibacter sp.]